MPEKVNINAYFERIGFAGSIAPTIQTLELLHALHPAVIPFENLSSLVGEPVQLDQQSLERKLLSEKRGGYGFEHNTLFMRELLDLEFSVRPLLARVIWTSPDAVQLPPTHMLLLVDIKGQNYIADVGFGGLSLTTPLRLRADVEQTTPHETFRLVGGDPDWTLEVRLGEEWRGIYVFNTSPVEDAQLREINAELSASEASPFTHQLRAALSPSGRRIKLDGNRLSIEPNGEEAEVRMLNSVADIRAALSEHFGLGALPEGEKLDQKLASLLPEPVAAETSQ